MRTRTTRTPAFWGHLPLPHDYPYYWFILDPKSKEDKVKVTNLKNSPKFQLFQVLLKIDYRVDTILSTDGQTDGGTDGQGETSIPPFQLHWSSGYNKNDIHTSTLCLTCLVYILLMMSQSIAGDITNALCDTIIAMHTREKQCVTHWISILLMAIFTAGRVRNNHCSSYSSTIYQMQKIKPQVCSRAPYYSSQWNIKLWWLMLRPTHSKPIIISNHCNSLAPCLLTCCSGHGDPVQ